MNEDEHILHIGTREVGGAPFGVRPGDRRRHVYLVGKSGSGKTTVLRNLLVQELLDFIPPHRIDGVVYFDVGDFGYPIGWNLLQGVDPEDRHLATSGVVGAFKAIWKESWGASPGRHPLDRPGAGELPKQS